MKTFLKFLFWLIFIPLFFMFPYLFAIPGIILIAWALATKK